MPDIDLRALSDEQLDQLRRDVAIERERRDNLEEIPDQMRELSRKYVDGGGDPAALADAITPDIET